MNDFMSLFLSSSSKSWKSCRHNWTRRSKYVFGIVVLANLFFQFSWCYMYFALRPISLSLQMNKCLSDNQRLWKDRVTMLEEKIDITIKQKEKVTAGHFWRRQNFESSSNFFEFFIYLSTLKIQALTKFLKVSESTHIYVTLSLNLYQSYS